MSNPGKAQFKVLFWRKWQMEGPVKTLGSLALAIAKASGKALARAGKWAFDFRQPALPGLDPAPGQDLPAIPPARELPGGAGKHRKSAPPRSLNGLDLLLGKSCDWRVHPVWNWISGGGLKGFLGVRRFWAIALRHFLDGIGRVGWTFRVAAIEPLKFATKYAAMMSTAIPDFIRFRDAGLFHRPPTAVIHRIFWQGFFPPVLGVLVLFAEDMILNRTVGLPTFLYDFSAIAAALAVAFPVFLYFWCLDGIPRHLAGQKWPLRSNARN